MTILQPGENIQAKIPLISFFVACYNEEENVYGTLSTLRAACVETQVSFEIIAVDDGSRDKTSEVIEQWISENPGVPIQLIRNTPNLGLAKSYVKASRIAQGTWYRLICGDNIEPKETFVTLIKEIGTADVLLPHYIFSSGKSISRLRISALYTFLVNLLSGHRIRYYNGMPVTKTQYARKFANETLGFGFQADFVCQLLDRRITYREIGVKGTERQNGSSTALTTNNFICVTKVLIILIFRRIKNFFIRPTLSN